MTNPNTHSATGRRTEPTPLGAGFTSISSSMLTGAKVDGDDLLVRFTNGKVYRYPGQGGKLPALVEAPSSGRYFHGNLRHLPCEECGGEGQGEGES